MLKTEIIGAHQQFTGRYVIIYNFIFGEMQTGWCGGIFESGYFWDLTSLMNLIAVVIFSLASSYQITVSFVDLTQPEFTLTLHGRQYLHYEGPGVYPPRLCLSERQLNLRISNLTRTDVWISMSSPLKNYHQHSSSRKMKMEVFSGWATEPTDLVPFKRDLFFLLI